MNKKPDREKMIQKLRAGRDSGVLSSQIFYNLLSDADTATLEFLEREAADYMILGEQMRDYVEEACKDPKKREELRKKILEQRSQVFSAKTDTDDDE